MKPPSPVESRGSLEPQIATVRLKAGEENRLLSGHPWVFSNEIASADAGLEPGSLAVALNSRGQPLGIGFYNPRSLIAWRLLSRRVEAIGEDFFHERLSAALEFRRRIYPGQRSFRLCFGESDALPGLVVDKYEEVLTLQVLSAGMDRQLDAVVAALRRLVSPRGIYLNDHPARSLEGLAPAGRVLFGEVPPRVTIEEGGLRFITPLTEGQKTGFYFDQRENRARAAEYAQDRRVLDLYCYTGAFSLSAARSGAAQVLGLDSSGPAVELARQNAELNGLAERCGFDEGDAEEVLAAFSERGQRFEPDFILLDPPSFAPSKKFLMKALRAYTRLNSLAFKCLRRGGLLASSVCSHHVGREDFIKMLRQAAAKSGHSARFLELRTQSRDHPILLSMPETEYLHFALLEVL